MLTLCRNIGVFQSCSEKREHFPPNMTSHTILPTWPKLTFQSLGGDGHELRMDHSCDQVEGRGDWCGKTLGRMDLDIQLDWGKGELRGLVSRAPA